MHLLEEILVRVAEYASLIVFLTWVGLVEYGCSGIIDGFLEVGLGSVVKVLPVSTATIFSTSIGCSHGLEGERIALTIYSLDVATASLIASCLQSHAANESVDVGT